MDIGWWVAEKAKNTAKPDKKLSRVYQVREAAQEFADLARKQHKEPERVVIRSNVG